MAPSGSSASQAVGTMGPRLPTSATGSPLPGWGRPESLGSPPLPWAVARRWVRPVSAPLSPGPPGPSSLRLIYYYNVHWLHLGKSRKTKVFLLPK